MNKISLLCISLCLIVLTACTTTEKDTTKPIILVTGGTTQMIVGDTFTPPSIHVSDNLDTDMRVVITGDTVDVNVPGVYTLVYNAQDTSGNSAIEKKFTVTVYDYIEQMNIVNGGFETGNLNGWTLEEVNGSSDAFSDALVINTANRKEGTYFFDGSKTDDDKVGAIKSTNFILGGSGWMNFRLGGGNDIETLYLAVYRASDNEMVAKFSNSNPQKYGGNEFLVGYMFNLLTVQGVERGDELYIKVVDMKLENWAIIKIDDIVTFNIKEPSSIIYETVLNQI